LNITEISDNSPKSNPGSAALLVRSFLNSSRRLERSGSQSLDVLSRTIERAETQHIVPRSKLQAMVFRLLSKNAQEKWVQRIGGCSLDDGRKNLLSLKSSQKHLWSA
jgi:hypothetical protein